MALIVTHLQANEGGHLHYVRKYRSRFLSYGTVLYKIDIWHMVYCWTIYHTQALFWFQQQNSIDKFLSLSVSYLIQ